MSVRCAFLGPVLVLGVFATVACAPRDAPHGWNLSAAIDGRPLELRDAVVGRTWDGGVEVLLTAGPARCEDLSLRELGTGHTPHGDHLRLAIVPRLYPDGHQRWTLLNVGYASSSWPSARARMSLGFDGTLADLTPFSVSASDANLTIEGTFTARLCPHASAPTQDAAMQVAGVWIGIATANLYHHGAHWLLELSDTPLACDPPLLGYTTAGSTLRGGVRLTPGRDRPAPQGAPPGGDDYPTPVRGWLEGLDGSTLAHVRSGPGFPLLGVVPPAVVVTDAGTLFMRTAVKRYHVRTHGTREGFPIDLDTILMVQPCPAG